MALPLSTQEMSIPQIIRKIESGLPSSTFTTLRNELEVTDKELAEIIRVPKSTLAARKKRGRFSFEESERLYRIQRLFAQTVDVFDDVEAARKWLKEKAYGLGESRHSSLPGPK